MNILLENINTTLAKITECMARDPKRAERLLGDVKRWAGELAKAGTTLRAAGEPLFWYRPCRGGLYEGPHHNNSNLGKMLRDERPGEWVPLYAAPQASAEARELVADGWLDDHITANVKFTRGEMPGVYYCQGWRDAEAHYKLAAPAAEDSAKGAGDVEFPRMPEPAARTSAFSTNSQVVPYYTYGQMMAYAHTAVLADRKQRGGDVAALREALKFYADQDHFIIADDDAWDTVSGEPQNFFCDEAGTATVEDGSIARAALAAQNPVEGDAKEPIVTLSGHQLLEALDFIAPDRDTDPQQLEGDVSIQYGDGHAGRGHYCWVTDEAHEGAILLGDAAIAQQGKEGA